MGSPVIESFPVVLHHVSEEASSPSMHPVQCLRHDPLRRVKFGRTLPWRGCVQRRDSLIESFALIESSVYYSAAMSATHAVLAKASLGCRIGATAPRGRCRRIALEIAYSRYPSGTARDGEIDMDSNRLVKALEETRSASCVALELLISRTESSPVTSPPGTPAPYELLPVSPRLDVQIDMISRRRSRSVNDALRRNQDLKIQ